jgi:predicted transcriptional regulator
MSRLNTEEQKSVVNILLRYWEEISAMEREFSLQVGKGDMRPRIDYFHDAVRAYTSQRPNAEMQARLSIEMLSYDVQCLRYIASMPMASITHDAHNLSSGSQLIKTAPGLMEAGKRAGRDVKNRLQELYEQYGVLFASLLKQTAENEYLERTDALNHEVEEINRLIDALSNNASMEQVTTLINHLTDETLKRDLLLLIPQMKGKSAGALSGLIGRLRANIQKNDKRIRGVDNCYHQYVTAQLAIYEEAKDMLKKMASQGMNLVGQFVEASVRGTKAGRGR